MKNNSVKYLVTMALCVAMVIVLKLYSPTFGAIRIGISSLPALLAAVYVSPPLRFNLSPLSGALVAGLGDILGCLIKGDLINPYITAGNAGTALLCGVFFVYVFKKLPLTPRLILSVIPGICVGSLLINTYGLWMLYSASTPFLLYMLGRVPSVLINHGLCIVIIRLVMLNRGAAEFFEGFCPKGGNAQ